MQTEQEKTKIKQETKESFLGDHLMVFFANSKKN
jgi:hypothetical protein